MIEKIEYSLIAAIARNGVIGKDNSLPWFLPSDLQRFAGLTGETGVVVMGHNTWKSILQRLQHPLRGRHHIVLTHDPETARVMAVWPKHADDTTVVFVSTIEEVAAEVLEYARTHGTEPRASVIGGEKIYKLFLDLDLATYARLTIVGADFEGDTYFPSLPKERWELLPTSSPEFEVRDVKDQELSSAYADYKRIAA